jgi:hypothetical protein
MPIDLLKSLVNNAKFLSDLKTQKDRPRLFSRYRLGLDKKTDDNSEYKFCLAPTVPQSTYELNISKIILDKVKEVWDDNPIIFKKALYYFVYNTNSSKAGLIFSNPEDLKSFLVILNKFFKKKYIIVQFQSQKYSPKLEQVKLWKTAIGKMATYKRKKKEVKKKNQYPVGKVNLFITHPDATHLIEKNIKKGKKLKSYYSNILKFTFHLITIITLHKIIDPKLIPDYVKESNILDMEDKDN